MMAKAGYKLAYTLRFYLDTVSSDYTGTPLDDWQMAVPPHRL